MTELETNPAETDARITFETRLTGRCPHDTIRDHYDVTIQYRPGDCQVEIASLAAYLRSVEDTEISHEALCERVFQRLQDALDPATLTVEVSPQPYHGIHTTVERSTQ